MEILLPDEMINKIIFELQFICPLALHRVLFVSKQWCKVLLSRVVPITNTRQCRAAAKRGDYLSMTYWLNNKKEWKEQLLLKAIKYGYIAIVELLVPQVELSSNIVKAAYKSGDPQVIAIVTSRPFDTLEALCGACAGNQMSLVQELLTCRDCQFDNSYHRHTVLYSAAQGGNREILSLLRNKYGINYVTEAIGAITGGHWDLFQETLSNVLGDQESIITTAYHTVFRKGRKDLINKLSEYQPPAWNAVSINAVHGGNLELVQLCVDNIENKKDLNSLLVFCNRRMTLQLVQYLVNAMPSNTNKHVVYATQHCLEEATKHGYKDIVEYLTPMVTKSVEEIKFDKEAYQQRYCRDHCSSDSDSDE